MNEQINFVDMVKLLLSHWWKLALAALAGAVALFFLTVYCMTPIYLSRGSIYINNAGIGYDDRPSAVNLADIASAQQLAYTSVELLQSDSVLTSVIAKTELPYTITQISNMISIESMNETQIIEIEAIANDPRHAQMIVQAILEHSGEVIQRIVDGGNVKIVDDATFAKVPISPNLSQNVFLGFIAGGVICAVIICLINYFDNRIKQESDLMRVKELPLLGIIPDIASYSTEGK